MANKIAKVEINIDNPEAIGTQESTEYNFTAYDAQGEVIEEYMGASVSLIAVDLANAILNGLYAQQQGVPYGKGDADVDAESEGFDI